MTAPAAVERNTKNAALAKMSEDARQHLRSDFAEVLLLISFFKNCNSQ